MSCVPRVIVVVNAGLSPKALETTNVTVYVPAGGVLEILCDAFI